MMKIAIPVFQGRLNPHFGQTQAIEIVEVDTTSRVIARRHTLVIGPHDGCGALPPLLKAEGVHTVLCGGIGAGARSNLERSGLAVVAGAPVGDPAELALAYLAGTLQTHGGMCSHDHPHGHAHSHSHHHRHGQCGADGHAQGHAPRTTQEI
jgi:predicted Fe-Mo cluster-binding NifX family protein